MNPFPKTAAALAAYDGDKLRLNAMCDYIENQSDLDQFVAADDEAQDKVRRAFLEDTRDFNSWDGISTMTIASIRELVERNQ